MFADQLAVLTVGSNHYAQIINGVKMQCRIGFPTVFSLLARNIRANNASNITSIFLPYILSFMLSSEVLS